VLFSTPEVAEKLIMVPLDLTHSALLTKEIEKRIMSPKPSKFRQMWLDLGQFFAQTYADVFGITKGPPLHDVCAVHIANLVGRGVESQKGGRWYGKKMHCHVETGEGRTRGQTVCDVWNYLEGEGKITLACDIKVRRLYLASNNI
jgi:inosine-uridine nucleoside N-ribohydrolase